MSKEKKKRIFSIKSQIFAAMLALALVFILLSWTLQFAFLNIIFKDVKQRTIEEATVEVKNTEGFENINEFLSKITDKYDVGISAFVIKNGDKFYPVHYGEFSVSGEDEVNEDLIKSWYESTKEESDLIYVASGADKSQLIYMTIIDDVALGETYLVILNAVSTPPVSTKLAVRAMNALLSIVFFASAIAIAYFLSKSISRPVETMSSKAKNLTLYDYDVEFTADKGPSEIRELAAALNSATNELKKLSATQRELIANISHDLRTPLTLISGYSEVMRDFPDEVTPENMQIIIDETARLNSLVNDLLTVSKLQSGTQSIDPRKISLTKSILDTVKRYEKLLSHKEYKILFEYDCEAFVVADETRLLQVVYNLINNAVNYTGEDKTVTVKQEIIGDVVRISVIDTGEGISEENLPLIWDRYYKIDKVHKRAIHGTGLGLSIVKNILLLHDSRFGVSSEVGKGSIFWFEFKIEKNIND